MGIEEPCERGFGAVVPAAAVAVQCAARAVVMAQAVAVFSPLALRTMNTRRSGGHRES